MNEPMSSRRQLLSVVCPAYEEQQVLPAFHEALRAALRPLKSSLDLEIIYVDDGSQDQTFAIVHGLAARDPRMRERKKYGQPVPCHPSPFLKELPPELVEHADEKAKQPVAAESGKAMFDLVRSSLG